MGQATRLPNSIVLGQYGTVDEYIQQLQQAGHGIDDSARPLLGRLPLKRSNRGREFFPTYAEVQSLTGLDTAKIGRIYKSAAAGGHILLPAEAIFPIMQGYTGSNRPPIFLGMKPLRPSLFGSPLIFKIVPWRGRNKLFVEPAHWRKWRGSGIFVFAYGGFQF